MFKFTVTQNSPEILAMEMNGELNTVAAQDLQEEIESLQKDMVKPILIDVTRLNYISSTGLRIFMIIKKTANANGQTVTLKGLNDIVEKVFKMTGFDKMFEIV
ncbi:MAG: STAS domain-containing protein [Prevotella sp.]|nr:STAS domain-containing protein [Prevotella sp.]